MDREIGRQVKHVRAQLSNVFDSEIRLGLDDLGSFPGLNRRKMKAKTYFKLPHTTKGKEKMILPNISIHRNPLSYLTDREITRYQPKQRRRPLSKGSQLYKVAVKSTDEKINWDNVISTCSKLIKSRL